MQLQRAQQSGSLGHAHVMTELVGRLLQVAMMLARSAHEIFTVVLSSYWAYSGIRSVFGAPNGAAGGADPLAGAWGAAAPAVASAASSAQGQAAAAAAAQKAVGATGATAASGAGGVPRALLLSGIAVLALMLVEFFYERYLRRQRDEEAIADAQRRRIAAAATATLRTVPGSDAPAQPAPVIAAPSRVSVVQQRFVALQDFSDPRDGCLSFRCGDQLVLDQYDPDAWCRGVVVLRQPPAPGAPAAALDAGPSAGWVFGRFVRPLADATRKI